MPKIVLVVLLLLVACAPDPTTSSSTPSIDAPDGSPRSESTPPGGTAHRLLFWARCDNVTALSDADLDRWKSMGVDGFVCALQSLKDLGGETQFTSAPDADLSKPGFETQQSLRQTDIARRAQSRGMKLYLSFYLANASNTRTPLVEWFDDGGWQTLVVPRVRELAAVARSLGFAGVGFDMELYPQANFVQTASWSTGYPGSVRPGDEVRAQVKRRGAQMMGALLEGFPAVEIVAYGNQFPESWEQEVQRIVNQIDDPFGGSVQLDLWDGLTSVEGWSAIRLLNATFYKEVQVRGSDWDQALRFEYSRLYSLLSRRLANWAYAAPRFNQSPFIWINAGPSTFEEARSPGHVADQLDAFARWGMGGEFANYAHDGLSGFDYGPYVPDMQRASSARVVDTPKPDLSAVAAPPSDGTVRLSGTASDEYAVRFVRWDTGRATGMARMEAVPVGGDRWRVDWTADVPLAGGADVTVTVESIKGYSTSTKVVLQGAK